MVYSMTAYARKESPTMLGRLSVEIRGVNHRYLDISFRLPEDMRMLEPLMRERIVQSIKRGKLDVNLRWQGDTEGSRVARLNADSLKHLHQAAQRLQQQWHDLDQPTWLEVLRWPGLLEEETIAEDEYKRIVLSVLDDALAELEQSRAREGLQLQQVINERLGTMRSLMTRLETEIPRIAQQQKDKLLGRLADIKSELDQNRLEQELVYFANRMDVDEEMQRLRVHLQEVEQTLQRKEPVGRRLDFLLQELNREANTLGSKSVAVESTNAAVEMKVLIEQMREQVQNIE